ncbi:MAG: AAC(3) family N-acetyltransferase [Clostridium sp.]|nr:AAC(3) family N-acetyltransferase [Clostridium sp.]MCM1400070.1 AAC(3) family N-acetyltransferase [Clostridium sp.]MCM1459654.1 AAC(3) family N-acetyltransferase [Bacteroides sp.]
MGENKKLVLKKDFLEGFKNLGVKSGDVIIVHTALGSFGYVCGGAQTVIEALMESVGENGTIIMPTQSWKNLDPDRGVHWEISEMDWQLIRENWPAYDKDITPSDNMGIVAEMFRTWNGVVRSGHPSRSFAAWGQHAEYIVKDHDIENVFGENSPLHKIYQLDGKVLLLGVEFDKCTSLHLAESLATFSKRKITEHSAVMNHGIREWISYDVLDVDDSDFLKLQEDFEKNNTISKVSIGNAQARYFSQKRLVDFAVKWFEKNRI